MTTSLDMVVRLVKASHESLVALSSDKTSRNVSWPSRELNMSYPNNCIILRRFHYDRAVVFDGCCFSRIIIFQTIFIVVNRTSSPRCIQSAVTNKRASSPRKIRPNTQKLGYTYTATQPLFTHNRPDSMVGGVQLTKLTRPPISIRVTTCLVSLLPTTNHSLTSCAFDWTAASSTDSCCLSAACNVHQTNIMQCYI